MNIIQDVSHPVENVDELLIKAFGNPGRHPKKSFGTSGSKAKRPGDIGLPSALYDWRAKHYGDWKRAYMPQDATSEQSRIASDRRASFLFRYVLLPLAAFWILANVIEWTTGFDCTDVIPTNRVLWTIVVPHAQN